MRGGEPVRQRYVPRTHETGTTILLLYLTVQLYPSPTRLLNVKPVTRSLADVFTRRGPLSVSPVRDRRRIAAATTAIILASPVHPAVYRCRYVLYC